MRASDSRIGSHRLWLLCNFFLFILNSSSHFTLLNRCGDTMAFPAPCHCRNPSDNSVSWTPSVPPAQSLNRALAGTLSAAFGGTLLLWSHVKADI